jgi:hypothetical protein
MSNVAGTGASREEEIAFLVMEQVLGVDIRLADAGAGNNMPDGSWTYSGDQKRRGIVEITSPPDTQLMASGVLTKYLYVVVRYLAYGSGYCSTVVAAQGRP